jgi:prepilin-type N-terminal cleavage/methylation domain-containing protein
MTKTMTRHVPRAATLRRGFTLIELLVVISIIAVLASLIMPAIMNARASARRIQCSNNMKQVAAATMNFTTGSNGILPGVYDWYPDANKVDKQIPRPWTTALLPFLDRNDLQRVIQEGNLRTSVTGLETPHVEAFTCVVDENNFNVPGGLSYVGNGGYIPAGLFANPNTHSAQNNTFGVTAKQCERRGYATGIFWAPDNGLVLNLPPMNTSGVPTPNFLKYSFRMSIGFISAGDGSSSTILLGENIQAGDWAWSHPVRGVKMGGVIFGMTYAQGSNIAAAGNAATALVIGNPVAFNSVSLENGRLNKFLTAERFVTPRPSSNHGDLINFAFCAGNVRPINMNVDPRVFARLVTPDGQRFGQQVLNDE